MLLFSILIAYNDLYLHKSRNYLSMKTCFLVVLITANLLWYEYIHTTNIQVMG